MLSPVRVVALVVCLAAATSQATPESGRMSERPALLRRMFSRVLPSTLAPPPKPASAVQKSSLLKPQHARLRPTLPGHTKLRSTDTNSVPKTNEYEDYFHDSMDENAPAMNYRRTFCVQYHGTSH